MLHKLKIIIRHQVFYVTGLAGKKVIETNNAMTVGEQKIAEVGANKASATGNKHLHRPTP